MMTSELPWQHSAPTDMLNASEFTLVYIRVELPSMVFHFTTQRTVVEKRRRRVEVPSQIDCVCVGMMTTWEAIQEVARPFPEQTLNNPR